MTNQREAFKKWFDEKFPESELSLRLVIQEIAFFSWQAAQEDKIDFARKVAEVAMESKRDSLFVDMDGDMTWEDVDLDTIITKVEQEQC